uniref:Uncharacterized protein n=1 Tax=Eutreptiella gymnastica TaxID=73025 RepID=A0A6U8CBL8_9EUGL|mmetsp:Transcript_24152/g.43562  ORF Transcript_24152/g.43562 Transcript_24152/m.43562 type:complete len:405 (+) Transcript_24152:38-1252(+)
MGCGASAEAPEKRQEPQKPKVEKAAAAEEAAKAAEEDEGELKMSGKGPEVGAAIAAIADKHRYDRLDISKCELAEVPDSAWTLKNLTALNVNENRLNNIGHIAEFKADLQYLDISDNALGLLHPAIGQFGKLHTLYAFKCGLTAVPPELFKLTSLTDLNLFNNAIIKVPVELKELTALKELNLASNKLMQLPAGCLDGLKSLRRLAAFWNRILRLPSFESLEALEELQLNSNQLQEVPTFGTHPRLKDVNLQKNQISKIPEGIYTAAKFPVLESLELGSNQLEELPCDIAGLPSLTRLSLAENKLALLPVGLYQSKSLTLLNISNNAIEALPDEISNLKDNLATLFCANNKIKTLPASMQTLAKLARFNCKGNPLDLKDATTNGVYESIKKQINDPKKFEGVPA